MIIAWMLACAPATTEGEWFGPLDLEGVAWAEAYLKLDEQGADPPGELTIQRGEYLVVWGPQGEMSGTVSEDGASLAVEAPDYGGELDWAFTFELVVEDGPYETLTGTFTAEQLDRFGNADSVLDGWEGAVELARAM